MLIMKNPVFVETRSYYGYKFPNGFIFEIPKDLIATTQQFADWYAYLDEKNWFNERQALHLALAFITRNENAT